MAFTPTPNQSLFPIPTNQPTVVRGRKEGREAVGYVPTANFSSLNPGSAASSPLLSFSSGQRPASFLGPKSSSPPRAPPMPFHKFPLPPSSPCPSFAGRPLPSSLSHSPPWGFLLLLLFPLFVPTGSFSFPSSLGRGRGRALEGERGWMTEGGAENGCSRNKSGFGGSASGMGSGAGVKYTDALECDLIRSM